MIGFFTLNSHRRRRSNHDMDRKSPPTRRLHKVFCIEWHEAAGDSAHRFDQYDIAVGEGGAAPQPQIQSRLRDNARLNHMTLSFNGSISSAAAATRSLVNGMSTTTSFRRTESLE